MARPARFRLAPDRIRGRGPVLVLLAAIALPELALWGADLGLWGSVAWRLRAFQYGAFWGGLLRDWQPNYPLQPWLMFLSYAVLHAGPGHLLGNLLVLGPLLDEMVAWLGARRAMVLGAASTCGGALAFGLLSSDLSPMVGASGLAFGLAGALVAREATGVGGPGGWRRATALALGLVAINVATWIVVDRVAWETHAGGTVAGALAAWGLRRRPPSNPEADPA